MANSQHLKRCSMSLEKCKIKTVMRYCFTSIRAAILKGKVCNEIGTLIHGSWNLKWHKPSQKIVWWFFSKLKRITIWPSHPTPQVCTQKNLKSRCSNNNLHMNGYSVNYIHNGQKAETIMPISGWTNKEMLVYMYDGILLIHKKEEPIRVAT